MVAILSGTYFSKMDSALHQRSEATFLVQLILIYTEHKGHFSSFTVSISTLFQMKNFRLFQI